MTARSHIRHYVIGDEQDRFEWVFLNPAATAIHVPVTGAVSTLATLTVNPWDQIHPLSGYWALPVAERCAVWDAVQSARAAGRRLTPAERRGGAA